jgi:WD40 repeat protein
MNISTMCPPTEELQQLISGSLSTERQEACTRHMDSCECCQAKLEEIATGGSNLSRVVERLHEAEPAATSAYWPALNSLGTEANLAVAKVAAKIEERPRDLSLHFLQPSSDPAYLGRLAHFDVMRVVGRGGMGVVFEAFDTRLQRNVALKVLDPEFADDDSARQRFCREARAAASISHENVVAVHQVEKADGERLPFLVMQLIAGESLEQRLTREKKLPLREIVRIAMQAAHGLVAAHAQGLIHRDIKPANILLESTQDQVKLTDFGLARVAEDVKLTRTGFVAGTPLYMSPEQAMGEATDHRSDLFSLGVILYEMCAGESPFAANSALAILRKIVDSKPRPLRELNPAIPEWFTWTVDQLLAKKPDDRIQTAAQLAELLDFQWALMKTSSDEVPTVCEIEMRKEARRNRMIAAAIGATFLAIGLAVGMFMTNRSGLPAAAVSSAEPVAVLSANAGSIWSAAFDVPGDIVAMAVEDGTVRLWDLPSKNITSTLNAHRGTVWSTQFAPNNELLATCGDDGFIKLWKMGQSEPVHVFQHPTVRTLTFAHDSRTLFGADRSGGLRAWSLDATAPLAKAEQPGSVYAVAISPNDETLATAGSDKIVRLWNAKDLTQRLPLEGHTAPIYSVSFNNDGRRLASAGWDKTVRIWDVGSGQLVKSWQGHSGDIWDVAYSPDGARLATAGTDQAVKLWDAETGELLATFLGHSVAVHSVAFSADGKLLASGGRDGTVRVWRVE